MTGPKFPKIPPKFAQVKPEEGWSALKDGQTKHSQTKTTTKTVGEVAYTRVYHDRDSDASVDVLEETERRPSGIQGATSERHLYVNYRDEAEGSFKPGAVAREELSYVQDKNGNGKIDGGDLRVNYTWIDLNQDGEINEGDDVSLSKDLYVQKEGAATRLMRGLGMSMREEDDFAKKSDAQQISEYVTARKRFSG